MNIDIQSYRGFAIFLVNVMKSIKVEAIIIGNTSCTEEKRDVSYSFGAVVK